MIDLPPELAQCAPQVSPVLMHALVRTESSWNPYAIGPDAGQPAIEQPRSLEDAIKTVKRLGATGGKFSVGLAQIHVSNVASRRMSWEQAFDPCKNLKMGQTILFEYYGKALKEGYSGVDAVWAALRGYNSGGVHKTVSDKYASKIFSYMQSQTEIKKDGVAKTTPASTDPRFAQLANQMQIGVVESKHASVQPSTIAIGPADLQKGNKDSVRPGESPDIFQAQGEVQGF